MDELRRRHDDPALEARRSAETLGHLAYHLADALQCADVGLDEQAYSSTFRLRRVPRT